MFNMYVFYEVLIAGIIMVSSIALIIGFFVKLIESILPEWLIIIIILLCVLVFIAGISACVL